MPIDFGRLNGVRFAVRSTMERNRNPQQEQPQIDPSEWKTGDEPMTPSQRSYLETLCRDTGEEFDDTLTKAEASELIDALRSKSPRLANE